MKPISQKRAEAAEDACRAFRRWMSMRDCERTMEDGSEVFRYLQRWMRMAGKSQYSDPKPLRRKNPCNPPQAGA